MNQKPTSGVTRAPQGVQVDNMGRGSDEKNYTNFYNNWIYCPCNGCGYDVSDNYFKTGCCPRTGMQHNPSITWKNTMGGCQKNAHKYILPNAVGKMGDTQRKQQGQAIRQQQNQWQGQGNNMNRQMNMMQGQGNNMYQQMNMMNGNQFMGQNNVSGGMNGMGMANNMGYGGMNGMGMNNNMFNGNGGY